MENEKLELVLKEDYFNNNLMVVPAECRFDSSLIDHFIDLFNRKYSDESKEARQKKIESLITQEVTQSLPYIRVTRKEIKEDRLKIEKIVTALKKKRSFILETALGQANEVIEKIKRLEKVIGVVGMELRDDEERLKEIEIEVHFERVIIPILYEVIEEYRVKYPLVDFSFCRLPMEKTNEYYKKLKRVSAHLDEHYNVISEYVDKYAEVIQREIDMDKERAEKEKRIQDSEAIFERYLNTKYQECGIQIPLSSISVMIRQEAQYQDIIDYIDVLIDDKRKENETKKANASEDVESVVYEIRFVNKIQRGVFESWMKEHKINFQIR